MRIARAFPVKIDDRALYFPIAPESQASQKVMLHTLTLKQNEIGELGSNLHFEPARSNCVCHKRVKAPPLAVAPAESTELPEPVTVRSLPAILVP